MPKEKPGNNISGNHRPLIAQVTLSNAIVDFSTCGTPIAPILQSSYLELTKMRNQLLVGKIEWNRLVINTILFELEFTVHDGLVHLFVRRPLPMPAAGTPPEVENARKAYFSYQEASSAVYQGWEKITEDSEITRRLRMKDLFKELQIPLETFVDLFRLVKRIKSLLGAIGSAILKHTPPDSDPYNMAFHTPARIFVGFTYIYSKTILVAFLPYSVMSLSDLFFIQIKD